MRRNTGHFTGKGKGKGSSDDEYEHHGHYPAPLNDIEFEPSETCPKNYVIFDQTRHNSRVMFHPSLAHKLGSPGFDPREAGKSSYRDSDEEADGIDALLSSEEDDDDVSTGRTPSSSSGKKAKVKMMVKTLKGIVPGGDRMDTQAVLDEAVKYLKSLKVEAKKLGVKHLDH
ncbi:transcription factor bHLH144-like [Curcuma longa]|uniref:transcription factor bHLH144-like n=1 Tax=Curcuma longa TaxID=136217 RepID=UPI003D9EFA57